MNNLDKSNQLTSIVLLGCIIIIISSYIIFIIINFISELVFRYIEPFRGVSNGKRSRMIEIYKNDDIADPDENPQYNVNDPDSTDSIDPDNQEYNQEYF